jgi:hypothetical protein
MKPKQQSKIKNFLKEKYGSQKGMQYFEEQEKELVSALEKFSGKSKSQIKTLKNTILPRIALYKVLKKYEADTALSVMREYMMDVVGGSKHALTAKLEKIPAFFYIYRSIFLKIMRTTELQDSTQESGKDCYSITITRCLWHDACIECGCPELCRLFCDVDDVTYGGLQKIGFSRTKTLGYGGDCCDFYFYKKIN